VSDAIQVAMEGVMTGQLTPAAAAAAYGDQVKAAVGPDQVTAGS
jgi:hypothetical protein